MSFLDFRETKDTGRTKVWAVSSVGHHLGEVRWFAGWRRYTFVPTATVDADGGVRTVLFDAECLRELADFMDARMGERDAERREAEERPRGPEDVPDPGVF